MAPLLGLQGDDVEDQQRINAVLVELYELQSERPSLFKKAPYTVKMKSANEIARFEKMLDYGGPDARTLEFLESHKDGWISSPDSFWDYSPPPGQAKLEPQARIVMCYQSATHLDMNNIISVEDTATALYHRHRLCASFEQAKEILVTMIDAGHRYKNLEQSMGIGVPIVLGTSLSESCWTKLLPKCGPKFESMVARMRAIGVPHLAEEYAALRVRVVNSFLLELTIPTNGGPPLQHAEDVTAPYAMSAGPNGLVHPYELEWQESYWPCTSSNDIV